MQYLKNIPYIFKLMLLALCLTAFSSAVAQSSVWLVEKDGQKLYLGGTLHVLSSADFPLPDEYEQAYNNSDTLIFETDIKELSNPVNQLAIMTAMTYTDGRTLQSVLSPEVYQMLSTHMQSRGLALNIFQSFSAGGISLMLTVIELQALGLTESGVDEYYYNKAVADNKTLAFFETLDDQLGFLSVLGEGIEDQVVSHSISDLEKLPKLLTEMISQWREGDVEGMDNAMLDEFRSEYPDAYQSLIVNRNTTWLPIIETMLSNDQESEFVLVGVGHMVGSDGLLERLRQWGYKVQQI